FFTIKCFFSKFSGTKRKWVPEEDDALEDDALVVSMVDLHNVGTFNADTGFKADYLNEVEKMFEKVLPHAMLKTKPDLESRIRILKRNGVIVNDIPKKVDQFKHCSFPYYDQLTDIYAKDRATRKDTQTVANIIEEIDVEDVATTNTHEERNDFHGCEADVYLDDMDLSTTQLQPARNQCDFTFSKKKKNSNANDHISSTSFTNAITLLAKNVRTVGLGISRSIASEVLIQQKSKMVIQESALKLYSTLCEVEGLIEDERYCALNKLPNHPTQMFILFSLPSSV
ncbi:hypothetical protein Goklo_029770, partial [Gossypium klotzschianum]|nr:hypothetical protein [Gossypium klotzschianum]